MSNFVSYEDAKKIIKNSGLNPKTRTEYTKLIHSGALPDSLPINCYSVYKNKGWKGIGDYLGTGVISTQNMKFLPYEEAKEAISKMQSPPSSQKEYFLCAKERLLPDGVPHDPRTVYKKDFLGYPDFLNSKGLHSISRPELRLLSELKWIFGERVVDRGLNLSDGIKEIDVFIQSLRIGVEYDGVRWHRSKVAADKKKNALALKQGIIIFRMREQDSSRSMHLPPIDDEKDVLFDVKDDFFLAVKELVRKIKNSYPDLPDRALKNIGEYLTRRSFSAEKGYLKLIKSYGDRWATYEEAKQIITELGFATQAEFKSAAKARELPDRIPNDPYDYYKDKGWISWGDFLSTGSVASYNQDFLSLKEAKKVISNLPNPPKTKAEYVKFVKNGAMPSGLPLDPHNMYSSDSQWKGLPDFLGVRSSLDYVDYEKAKRIIAKTAIKITSQTMYRSMFKEGLLPKGLPGNPQGVYEKKGWISWYDFLGKSKEDDALKRKKGFLPYSEAKKILLDMKSPPKTFEEYRSMAKAGLLPDGLPKDPYAAYKNSGWSGVKSFLGKDK